MKLNKLVMLVGLPLVLGLASCGGDTPTESGSAKASGSGKASTSKSVAPKTSLPPKPTTTFESLDLEKATDGKINAVIKGTIKNYDKPDDMKFAFGISYQETVETAPATTSVNEEGSTVSIPAETSTSTKWLVGKETPAAADFTIAPVVDAATNKFVVTVALTGTAGMKAGSYSIWAGPSNAYCELTASDVLGGSSQDGSDSALGTASLAGTDFRYYFRQDQNQLIVEELPPLSLNEAFVKDEEGVAYLYIGGALNETKLTEAAFLALTPWLGFQASGSEIGIATTLGLDEVSGNWQETRITPTMVTDTVEGVKKGYVKADISGLNAGNYNTHMNLAENKQANCTMDEAIDHTAAPVTVGSKKYYVWADPTAGQDGTKFYGCLGLMIRDIAAPADSSAE